MFLALLIGFNVLHPVLYGVIHHPTIGVIMTFNDILKNKDASAEAKLQDLINLVAGIRKEYGNSDVEIDVPYVNTPEGTVSFKYLDAESKVVYAGKAVRDATVEAVEICESTQGAVLDKEIESLIAVCPILCNLAVSTSSKYI
jgi:hypothetical protein